MKNCVPGIIEKKLSADETLNKNKQQNPKSLSSSFRTRLPRGLTGCTRTSWPRGRRRRGRTGRWWTGCSSASSDREEDSDLIQTRVDWVHSVLSSLQVWWNRRDDCSAYWLMRHQLLNRVSFLYNLFIKIRTDATSWGTFLSRFLLIYLLN